MSTSPESIRAEDEIVTTISRWLGRHSSDEELRAQLQHVDLKNLGRGQTEAVVELRSRLMPGAERAGLEMVARETMEAVALGG
jgi:hypothetical protein